MSNKCHIGPTEKVTMGMAWYGYGQYTALDVLQAKKSCEKRSIRSNYAKKKKVPGW